MAVKQKEKHSEDETLLEKVEHAVEQPLTLLWAHIQPWQRDNQHITSGYRPASNSYYKSATSLGYLHNESVNIWSHLLGAILFAGGAGVIYSALSLRYQEASSEDLAVFACFFLGAFICLGLSATFHTVSNHSSPIQKFWNKLDYFGIVFLIVGSFIPSIYYGFTCDPNLITTYWTMICTFGAGCGITSLSPKFATPTWRPFRATMFCAMGLSAVFPVIHGLQRYGLDRMVDVIALPWLVSQGALYVLGATLYALRIPERLKPGQFDLFGSSHQIFHVLVVVAAITHLIGLVKAFDYHHRTPIASMCPDRRLD